jgi:hypothetical protein
VLLVPGFTTVADSFDTPTVEENLVQFLCAKGFDVWLLDYRASPALEPAWTQFTIDDIARHDYPTAVQAVCKATGVPQIQIVAHCVGSISLFMSRLAGGRSFGGRALHRGEERSLPELPPSAAARTARFRQLQPEAVERLEHRPASQVLPDQGALQQSRVPSPALPVS